MNEKIKTIIGLMLDVKSYMDEDIDAICDDTMLEYANEHRNKLSKAIEAVENIESELKQSEDVWVISCHGECDCGTDNNVKLCVSEEDARRQLNDRWYDMLDLYKIDENEIEWQDDEEVCGEYEDMEITQLTDSFSIYKGQYGSDFVHYWIQKLNK